MGHEHPFTEFPYPLNAYPSASTSARMSHNALSSTLISRQCLVTTVQYFFLVGIPVALLVGILVVGQDLQTPASSWPVAAAKESVSSAPMPNLLLLLGQMALIIAAARCVGYLFRAIHQPQVVGEMAAGILLGPSLLGWLAPEWFHTVFPLTSLGFLNSVSQIGLLVFMFLVGLEFDPKLLRAQGATVLITSHMSIAVPFVLGAALAYGLYTQLSDSRVSFIGFALFLGAAMSVTAFPVLARILAEKRLMHTRVGAAALACAAIDDVTAWTILAAVVLVVRSSVMHGPLWLTLGGSVLFVSIMVMGIHPLLRNFKRHLWDRELTHDRLAVVLVFALLSALTTEWLGIHALFGAFLAGAVLPKETDFIRALTEKLEDVTVVFLLPLFFAFTGLRTSIGLVSSGSLWATFGLIMAVAVVGKLGGSAVAARLTGMSWREASALAALLNTRGLMELVILNVGLDIGVISPTLFAMMVLMALATTFMTTPLLEWIYPAESVHQEQATQRLQRLPGKSHK